jgi:hypothetical protein
MTDGEIGYGCPRRPYVVDDGPAASIEREAAALTGRGIRVEVVIVRAEFEPGYLITWPVHRDRLGMENPGENEYKYQERGAAKMRHCLLFSYCTVKDAVAAC